MTIATSITLNLSAAAISSGNSVIATAEVMFTAPGNIALYNVSFTGVAAGQNVALPFAPGSFQLLVVNGLVQPYGSFSISTNQLIIPVNLVWDGAECTFYYSN